ncbi:MAG: [FeFe] hydrogenase H-cluster maturation GTPase HydF, partial [Lachnospiraceae bacterium]|nr:[FeFe] hydrogenase H-cluster maturation GTPase HydF [Lachnospiraceae bacterium]
PTAERTHIGFFGLRNAGKSSLVNRITNQEMSLVSDIKGTTTDPVKKSMELLPLGPVTIIDTPGYDDIGSLGEQRVRKTKETLKICDIAVLVTENAELEPMETELLSLIQGREIPCMIVRNKCDIDTDKGTINSTDINMITVSANTGAGIEELKERLARLVGDTKKEMRFIADLIKPHDTVVLVIPIDTSAPKGRLILPQQQAIRDILDAGAVSVVTGVDDIPDTLANLRKEPALVITDSQVFGRVMKLVPVNIPLTSFSILMARYKGFLKEALKGAETIGRLEDGANVLISEGCTHHRQCEDIGTVKLPKWLKEYTGKELNLSFTSGHGFPEDLSSYDLIIHCGACMLNDREVANRMSAAQDADVPFTNYGTAIAFMNGILSRSVAPVLPYL